MSNPKIYLAGKMDYSGHDANYESNWRAVLLGDKYDDIILTDKVDEYPIIENAIIRILQTLPQIPLQYTIFK